MGLGDWTCAMCEEKRTTLPRPHDPWGCVCGAPHLLCYGCVEEIGEVWLDHPSHLTLEFCPVSDEYRLARDLMALRTDSDADFVEGHRRRSLNRMRREAGP
ncbi:MAG TPA: hypothetical protein VMZ50_09945 [Phycisphaerae bacterium]|nr:hypothetical protein [Phycisphaerae bacterium]